MLAKPSTGLDELVEASGTPEEGEVVQRHTATLTLPYPEHCSDLKAERGSRPYLEVSIVSEWVAPVRGARLPH
jgi:hypothetical protein